MSYYTYIPFNTAAEPCVSYRKISKSYNIVMVKQGVARLFVYEFPKSTTERRQKLCIKVIVFKNNYMNICLDFV